MISQKVWAKICQMRGHKYKDYILKYKDSIWSLGPFKECQRCGHTVFLKNDGTPWSWYGGDDEG